MTERALTGLTLPKKQFKVVNKAIKDSYGMDIEEIAAVEPSFAFDALRTGLTALFTRRGHRELVQTTGTKDEKLVVTAVTEREMDGEAAFVGSVAHATNGMVDALVGRYERNEADFAIAVTSHRGFIGRLLKLEPTTEIAAIIPYVPPINAE